LRARDASDANSQCGDFGSIGIKSSFDGFERWWLPTSLQRSRTRAQVIDQSRAGLHQRRFKPRPDGVRQRTAGCSSDHDEVMPQPE